MREDFRYDRSQRLDGRDRVGGLLLGRRGRWKEKRLGWQGGQVYM